MGRRRRGAWAHIEAGYLPSVKTLRKSQTQTPAAQVEAAAETEAPGRTETWRPRLTRRSTILDYINVVPGLVRAPAPALAPGTSDGKGLAVGCEA